MLAEPAPIGGGGGGADGMLPPIIIGGGGGGGGGTAPGREPPIGGVVFAGTYTYLGAIVRKKYYSGSRFSPAAQDPNKVQNQ
jgi:hypothetical protein